MAAVNNINNINVNKLVVSARKFKTGFELNPLDVGLVEIQKSLGERLEREMPEYGDFAPVVERFESKNPEREFSTIKFSCSHEHGSLTKTMRNLELSVMDKARVNEYQCILKQADKDEMLRYVKDSKFFSNAKNVIMLINDEIKAARK